MFECVCGRTFDKELSLYAHQGWCNKYHELNGLEMKSRTQKGMMRGWQKFSDEQKQQMSKKSGETLKKKFKNGELVPAWKGRKHSEEFKEKMREKAIDRIENQSGSIRCNFSERACEFIDRLNEKMHWNLQHAKNGGEVRIGNFFVDGYDKERNIVFEYDEKKHYADVEHNVLKDKDYERQNKIIEILGCKFYRYNEANDSFYETGLHSFRTYNEAYPTIWF
jgi:hypothetical protein